MEVPWLTWKAVAEEGLVVQLGGRRRMVAASSNLVEVYNGEGMAVSTWKVLKMHGSMEGHRWRCLERARRDAMRKSEDASWKVQFGG